MSLNKETEPKSGFELDPQLSPFLMACILNSLFLSLSLSLSLYIYIYIYICMMQSFQLLLHDYVAYKFNSKSNVLPETPWFIFLI